MKSCMSFAAVFVLLLFTHPFAARYAVLTGNPRGQSGDVPLKYVENDLTNMRKTLIDVCGFRPQDIFLAHGAGVAAIDSLFRLATARNSAPGQGDLFLFYYSGHADNQALRLGNERLPFEKLKEQLATVPASLRIALFDACQSGSFARLKGGKLAEPFLLAADRKIEGTVVLSSSSASQNSQESDALKGSVFTFHIINGLRGSADLSGDQRVTLNEAYRYAYDRTVAQTVHSVAGAQHPSYQFRIQGEGDIVLADLNLYSTGLLLDTGVEGEVTILDPERNIVADLHKKPDSRVMVALTPGSYELFCRSAKYTTAARATVGRGSVTTVSPHSFSRSAQSAASRAKGSEPLDTYGGLWGGIAAFSFAGQSVEQGVQALFDDYKQLGIEVTPSFARALAAPRIGAHLWVLDRFGALFSFGIAATTERGSATGSAHDPLAFTSGPVTLDWESKMFFACGQFALAYRFHKGVLRNVSLEAGVALTDAALSVTTSLTDGLFDRTVNSSDIHSTLRATPFAGVAYYYPLSRHADIGLNARYRYDTVRRGGALDGIAALRTSPPLGYRELTDATPNTLADIEPNLSSVEIGLFLTWNIGNE